MTGKSTVWLAGALGVLALCAVAGLPLLRSMRDSSGPGAPAEQYAYRQRNNDAQSASVLWQAPTFSFTDQQGHTLSNTDLVGRVWIADFIYTTCTSVCPAITAKMVLLQRRLSDENLRFVSFSVDPEHDTKEALTQYANSWRPEEERWLLLHTEKDTLARLADGMHVATEPTQDPVNPILHSSFFFLVDAKGAVRSMYDSNDSAALDRLVADAKQLLASSNSKPPGASAAAASAAVSGQALFMALACNACHTNSKVAPSLTGLLGTSVQLASGEKTTIDEAYIRNSIVAPGSQLVSGYLGLMPSYQDQLSGQELDQLVAYVVSLSSPKPDQKPTLRPEANPAASSNASRNPSRNASATASASPAPAVLTTDPVCKMQVRADQEALHSDFDGKRYYFCSPTCRDHFAQDPKKYLALP
jgi:protein SCO1/2